MEKIGDFSNAGGSTKGVACPSDQELWNMLRGGDKTALAHIYQAYFFALYNYGINFCGEDDLVKDSIQDLFIYLWRKKETLGDTDSIKNYLLKSLRRSIVAQLKQKRHTLFNKGIPNNYHFEFILSHEHEIIDGEVSADREKELLKTINQLPQRLKEVLFLRYYEQLSPAEIASVMNVTIDSTYVFLSRAVQFLRKHMSKVYALLLAVVNIYHPHILLPIFYYCLLAY